MVKLIDRFRGEHGQRLLRDALSQQSLLQGLPEAIEKLISAVTLTDHPIGSEIIQQAAADNDIHFILSGRVSIVINKRLINSRSAGQHVGEMALIDSGARRSATVVTVEETVVARVAEPAFSVVANQHPELWRRLAIELANRLRQRTKGIHPPNEIPSVFIGSSKEALQVARLLESGLSNERTVVKVWDTDIFQASDTAIESLEDAIMQSDFAILVLAPDDYVESRNERRSAPRDNVIFELGLFMGALGRQRTYILSPPGSAVKKPSDLLGINVISYTQETTADLAESVADACKSIRKRIDSLGPK
jgi:predicted nucleotide-binding protein